MSSNTDPPAEVVMLGHGNVVSPLNAALHHHDQHHHHRWPTNTISGDAPASSSPPNVRSPASSRQRRARSPDRKAQRSCIFYLEKIILLVTFFMMIFFAFYTIKSDRVAARAQATAEQSLAAALSSQTESEIANSYQLYQICKAYPDTQLVGNKTCQDVVHTQLPDTASKTPGGCGLGVVFGAVLMVVGFLEMA